MAEDKAENDLQDDAFDDVPRVPSRAPLPLPPEVAYTRPRSAYESAIGTPSGKSGAESRLNASDGAASHGAGLAAGTTFVVSIVAGALAGNWMDTHWVHSSTPWATIAMTVLGAATGFLNLTRIMARSTKNKDDKK